MFKKNLLYTTALIAAASLFPDIAQAFVCPSHLTRHDNKIRSANDEFLSYYGKFLVSGSSGGSSSLETMRWTHVAVPMTGTGKTVNKIKVKEGQGRFTSSSTFFVGIYSNTSSGVPGNLITQGQGTAAKQFATITVAIAPTQLKRKTTYWIEETVPWGSYFPTFINWKVDPKSTQKTYVQTHSWCVSSEGGHHSHNYTSPWTKQTTGPYVRVK